jgi:hypothetical protein
MKTTSKDGLLLEARIVCDGRRYFLICSIEGTEEFCFGSFGNIGDALKGLNAFQMDNRKFLR